MGISHPFPAQVYDTGALLKDDAKILDVEDVQVYGGYVVHVGAPLGPLKVGDDVACAVDYDRRVRVAPNHTMTHVLNFALREVLLGGSEGAKADAEKTGVDRCAQRGSYVDDERRSSGQEKRATFPNFKGADLGRVPLVSADFWTNDHLSERSRRVDACSGTRARGTLTLKRP